jgi:superfamily II DNA helicase RecQ
MNQPVVDLQEALRDYFGFNQFKDEQEAIIQTVMDGKGLPCHHAHWRR